MPGKYRQNESRGSLPARTRAGLTGVIGGFSRGAGILEILALAGIGVLGLFLTVGYILVRAKKPRRTPKRPR
nr:hypothetical protein OH820_18760 [Streptomyces sp. NBC_00857]